MQSLREIMNDYAAEYGNDAALKELEKMHAMLDTAAHHEHVDTRTQAWTFRLQISIVHRERRNAQY